MVYHFQQNHMSVRISTILVPIVLRYGVKVTSRRDRKNDGSHLSEDAECLRFQPNQPTFGDHSTVTDFARLRG